jgi:hypothetical protein
MHCRLAVWAAARVAAADSASRALSVPTSDTDTAKNTETTANVRLRHLMVQPSPEKVDAIGATSSLPLVYLFGVTILNQKY